MGTTPESQFGIEFKTDFGPMRGGLSRFWERDRGLIMLWLLLILMPLVAEAQWDQVQIISPDSFYNAWPQIVVDDSIHLQVFCPRGLNGNTPLPSSLFYLKLDNWGNLLSGPTELWPGNQYHDYSPGVLLDRSGVIHIVWSRWFDWPLYTQQVIYARMNRNGEFLTGPTVIDTTTNIQQGMNLVQAENGDVWGVGEGYVCAFHENGELFLPLQSIFPQQDHTEIWYPIAATGPDGHVYAAARYMTPGDTQCVIVTRLDTTVREATVISPGTSPSDPVNMGPGSFYIDSASIRHTMIGRDDNPWWFYQRNLTDGTLLDTLNIAWLGYGPPFELVGQDTLELLWAGEPYPYRWRAAFRLNGTRAYGPLPIYITPAQFTWDAQVHWVWKGGSYWVLGLVAGQNGAHHIGMIHVPGPNEPPNAVRDRQPLAPVGELRVSVSPNPVQNELRLLLSGIAHSRVTVKLFNLLGQQIVGQEFERHQGSLLVVSLPRDLPSGSYYGIVTAGRVSRRFSFIHL